MVDRRKNLRVPRAAVGLLAVFGLVIVLVVSVFVTIAVVGVQTSEDAKRQAEQTQELAASNATVLRDLCTVARNQRRTLELQYSNSEEYLATPAGKERNGLNDYIRKLSVPQLRNRLRTEQVPRSCRPKPRRAPS